MRKYLNYFLIFILFLFLGFLIYSFTFKIIEKKIFSIIFLSIYFILFSIFFIILRKSRKQFKFLYIIILLSIVCGLVSLLLLWPFYIIMSSNFQRIIVLLLFVAGAIICFFSAKKRTIYGIYVFITIILFSILISFYFSEKQKRLLAEFEKENPEFNVEKNLKELFPMPYSKPQCEEWIEKISTFTPPENKKCSNFYNDFAEYYQSEEFWKFLKKGENPKEKILSDPKTKDKIWDEFWEYNKSIVEAMDKCPHIQWFKPEEYKDRLMEVPSVNLLAIIIFSRILSTYSIILSANEKENERNILLDELYEVSQKLRTKGQPLINTLIRIAIERIYIINEAYSIQTNKKPLSSISVERIKNISDDDFSEFLSSVSLDYLVQLQMLKNLKLLKKDKVLYDLGFKKSGKLLKYIPNFFIRSYLFFDTKNFLYNVNAQSNYFFKNIDPKGNWFFFFDFKYIFAKKSIFFASFFNAYAINLVLISQARLLLLANDILKFYKENGHLPDVFPETSKYIDPFSEEPLIYKKLSDSKFLVYSVGWNTKDDQCKNLYISGAIKVEKRNWDVGFCFDFK